MRTANYLEETQKWVETVVIGLNLCPFAHKPFREDRIRYVCTEVSHPEGLLEVLYEELVHLQNTQAAELETTLLVHPLVLQNFEEYLDFVQIAEVLVEEIGLEGVIQLASFHPDYQFAGTSSQSAENYTNRSPYPMLHLIREESITKGLEAYKGDPKVIPQNNIARIGSLSQEEKQRLFTRPNAKA